MWPQPVSSPNIHLPGPLASLKRTTGENGQAPLSGPTPALSQDPSALVPFSSSCLTLSNHFS